MTISVQILSMCKYTSKKDNAERVRLDYICNEKEKIFDKPNFKGFGLCTAYVNPSNWDKLTVDLIGVPVQFTIEQALSLSDPMKPKAVLKEIVYKNGNISII